MKMGTALERGLQTDTCSLGGSGFPALSSGKGALAFLWGPSVSSLSPGCDNGLRMSTSLKQSQPQLLRSGLGAPPKHEIKMHMFSTEAANPEHVQDPP